MYHLLGFFFLLCSTKKCYSYSRIVGLKLFCMNCGLRKDNRTSKKKGKAVPLQAWRSPEVSRKLRFADFMTTVQDGGKVVSLRHRSPLPPVNTPGTHFC